MSARRGLKNRKASKLTPTAMIQGTQLFRRMTMIQLTNFEVQNWVITPAALALNEARPRTIHDQKWLLVLTGAVDAHLTGANGGPLEQEVQILPDIVSPCH